MCNEALLKTYSHRRQNVTAKGLKVMLEETLDKSFTVYTVLIHSAIRKQ